MGRKHLVALLLYGRYDHMVQKCATCIGKGKHYLSNYSVITHAFFSFIAIGIKRANFIRQQCPLLNNKIVNYKSLWSFRISKNGIKLYFVVL